MGSAEEGGSGALRGRAVAAGESGAGGFREALREPALRWGKGGWGVGEGVGCPGPLGQAGCRAGAGLLPEPAGRWRVLGLLAGVRLRRRRRRRVLPRRPAARGRRAVW